jgi:hypothetical protein
VHDSPFSNLDLRKNNLGNEGASLIGKALSRNSRVVHLDVGSNDIGYEGASALFSQLAYNNTLTSISFANIDGLRRNRVGI